MFDLFKTGGNPPTSNNLLRENDYSSRPGTGDDTPERHRVHWNLAFALSGIGLAASKHYDWLGGFVCGVAVAIGGGTIRDVMLGLNPFWMSSPIYLLFTFLAQLVVIVCHHYLKRLDNTWFLFDTLGLALSISPESRRPSIVVSHSG